MNDFIKAIKNKKLYQATNLNNKNEETLKNSEKDIKSEFIKMLKGVYSDEWLAVYQYSVEADFINKLNYDGKLSNKAYNQIVKELDLHTQEEFNHAKLIVPELILLGAEPVYYINDLEKNANAPMLIPSKDQNNILQQAITSEEGAIKAYTNIQDFIKDNPKICSLKFEDTIKFILDQEYEHKNDLDRLLKEFKN